METSALEKFLSTLPVPAGWDRKARLQSFVQKGFPTGKDEDWKYTDLRPLHGVIFSPTASVVVSEALNEAIRQAKLVNNCLVFIDGRYSPRHSQCNLPGLKSEIISESGIIPRGADSPEDFITLLNSACFADGVNIEVAAGKAVTEPLQIISCNSGAGNFSAVRLNVTLSKSASAQLIESHISLPQAALRMTLPVSEYHLAENSELHVTKIVCEPSEMYHLSNQQAFLDRAARFRSHVFTFSSGVTRNNLIVQQNGSDCDVSLLGLTVLDNEEHTDNHTVICHNQPNCHSNELYKGVYTGKSRGVFDGTIVVAKDAQKTNALQSNQAVLLSPTAQSTSRPQLKIWADDVKCTHGATCGALDEEALFYLRSRGIDSATARELMIQAFASEVIEPVRLTSLREYLFSQLAHKLKRA